MHTNPDIIKEQKQLEEALDGLDYVEDADTGLTATAPSPRKANKMIASRIKPYFCFNVTLHLFETF